VFLGSDQSVALITALFKRAKASVQVRCVSRRHGHISIAVLLQEVGRDANHAVELSRKVNVVEA
jgi:hypothetical protein